MLGDEVVDRRERGMSIRYTIRRRLAAVGQALSGAHPRGAAEPVGAGVFCHSTGLPCAARRGCLPSPASR